MSIEMVRLVIDAGIKPPSHKLAAVALAERCNPATQLAWVGHASMSVRVGVSVGQMKRIMRDLKDRGIVVVVANQRGGRPGSVPTYTLNVPLLIELTPEKLRPRVAQVIPLKGSGYVDGDRQRREGAHAGHYRGSAGAPQTGIGTPIEPKDARAHADACEGVAQGSLEGQNSRHQDQVSAATAEVDVAAVRQKLREMAEQMRQASDACKAVRRATYG